MSFKVLFVGRRQLFSKIGGDSIQAVNYKFILQRSLGIEILTIGEVQQNLHVNALHVFNLDSIHEIMVQLNVHNITWDIIIVTPIHVSSEYIKLFYKKTEYLDFLSRFVGESYYLKNLIKIIDLSFFHSIKVIFRSRRILQKHFVNSAIFIDFLSPIEHSWLEKDLNVNIPIEKCIFFSNGSQIPSKEHKPLLARGNDILIVSRVEAQKRIIETIQLITAHFPNLKIRICGAYNEANKKNKRIFNQLISQNKGSVEYLGFLSQEQLPKEYANSKVVILASHFEIAPIVETEAINNRCIYIGTNRSAKFHLGYNSLYYVDIYNNQAIVSSIQKAFDNINKGETFLFPEYQDWEQLSLSLVSKYKEIQSKR